MGNPGSNPDGIVSGSREILRALIETQENDAFIGVWAPRLGPGMFMCKVESIRSSQSATMILLKEQDLNGEKLHTHALYLTEILKAHKFSRIE